MEWIEGGAPLRVSILTIAIAAAMRMMSIRVTDERYLLEIAAEVRAAGVAVEIALTPG